MLFITSLLRQLDAVSDGNRLYEPARAMGQDVFYAPSVFNYYPADYRIPGTTLVAPQFGIHNTNTVLHRANFVHEMIDDGGWSAGHRARGRGRHEDRPARRIARWRQRRPQLVALVNTRLFGGGMPLGLRDEIYDAVAALPAHRARRARRARRSFLARHVVPVPGEPLMRHRHAASFLRARRRAVGRRAVSRARARWCRRRARRPPTTARWSACSCTAATTATTRSSRTTTTRTTRRGVPTAATARRSRAASCCRSRRRISRASSACIRTSRRSCRCSSSASSRWSATRARCVAPLTRAEYLRRAEASAQPVLAQRPAAHARRDRARPAHRRAAGAAARSTCSTAATPARGIPGMVSLSGDALFTVGVTSLPVALSRFGSLGLSGDRESPSRQDPLRGVRAHPRGRPREPAGRAGVGSDGAGGAQQRGAGGCAERRERRHRHARSRA